VHSSVTLGKLAVLITAVALAATGQVLLKRGMVDAQRVSLDSGRSLALTAASSPWVVGGLMVFGVSAVAWLLTLAHVPLSVAYPFNALGYVAILIASSVLLHERTNPWMWLGTLLVGAGLVLIVLAGPASSTSQGTQSQVREKPGAVVTDDVRFALGQESIALPPRRAT